MRGIATGPLAALAVFSGMALFPVAASAEQVDTRACTEDGHIMNTAVRYGLTTTQHVWHSVSATASGAGTGGKSNFRARIWADAQHLVWAADSADNYSNDQTWTKATSAADGTHIRTNRNLAESVHIQGIFDVFGSDPNCSTDYYY